MTEKLQAISRRFEEVGLRLQEPQIAGDSAQYRRLMKEYRELEPVAECIERCRAAQSALEQAQELMDESGADPELRELAREEFLAKKEELRALNEELKTLLLPRDENDDRSVIIEIRGGAGGEEAALFARSLLRMYMMYAQQRGFAVEILGMNETELGGVKEVSFSVEGAGAYSRFKFESGVHRVQRVPETETQGRVHTSTVTVAVMPQAEEVEVEILPADLRIDTFRSSGAGGQHINKTSSAIRVTHLPTGMVVECQDERSQYKNKDKALRVLRSRLLAQKQAQQDAQIAAERKSQVGTGDRSERVRTYNFPQGRVTDHRIGLTLYKLDAVMNGALDELVEALAASERAEKLKASTEEL